MLVVVAHSFLFYIFVFVLYSLLFNAIPHPSVDYPRVFTPILSFQPSLSESDSRHFYFNLYKILVHSFTTSAAVLSKHFFTHRRFLSYAPSPTFYLRLSRPPWEAALLA